MVLVHAGCLVQPCIEFVHCYRDILDNVVVLLVLITVPSEVLSNATGRASVGGGGGGGNIPCV